MATVLVNDNKRYTVDSLYQWDKNQNLIIQGLNIPDPEIHFTNSNLVKTIPGKFTVDTTGIITAEIPNSLLQSAGYLIVFVCGYEDMTFKTYHKINVPVKSRPQPADYTLTVNDDEVYSFNALSKRVADLEKALGANTGRATYYSYSANGRKDALVELTKSHTLSGYIPFISSSLKAVKTVFDTLKTKITAVSTTANQALSIAKGRNQAQIFGTTEDMNAWLSDANNAEKQQIGDNLYILDVEVPDWWIYDVLTEPDPDTGFYYKIAHLETQKADIIKLKPIITGETLWTNPDPTVEFAAQTVELDLSKYCRFKIVFYNNGGIDKRSGYSESDCSVKNLKYHLHTGAQYDGVYYRPYTITDTGVIFENGDNGVGSGSVNNLDNTSCIPYMIIGYQY